VSQVVDARLDTNQGVGVARPPTRALERCGGRIEALDSNQGVGMCYWNYSRLRTSRGVECLGLRQEVIGEGRLAIHAARFVSEADFPRGALGEQTNARGNLARSGKTREL
jgi:hypothetical protein